MSAFPSTIHIENDKGDDYYHEFSIHSFSTLYEEAETSTFIVVATLVFCVDKNLYRSINMEIKI